ncbi:MAG: DUF5684 domain-containing protein [Victivallaceae bacterium]|nr:DUF5684 domain-containing protein [Victivallaceae bacterium]
MSRLGKILLTSMAFFGATGSLLAAEGDGGSGGSTVVLLIQLVIAAVVIIGMWKVFTKAGQPGWAVLIPIYNIIVMLQIAGKPIWWIILFFIPIVNIVVAILVPIAIAKAFGKGVGFGLGLIFLGFIFYPILGFNDSQYVGA